MANNLCRVCNTYENRIAYHRKDGSPYFMKECNRCYYQKNRSKNLEVMKKAQVNRDLDPNRRMAYLIKQAVKRNKTWNLSYDECMSFWDKDCHYCGDKVQGLHLDRLNASEGYNKNNCVSACGTCNIAKFTLSHEDFINKCIQIANKHGGSIG